jgi:hypothetical protein
MQPIRSYYNPIHISEVVPVQICSSNYPILVPNSLWLVQTHSSTAPLQIRRIDARSAQTLLNRPLNGELAHLQMELLKDSIQQEHEFLSGNTVDDITGQQKSSEY